jgi:hypothetical protein
MVLTAILDCLVPSELDIFINTLTRDGIRCLSSDTPLETLHEQISTFSDQPIVIYGASSLQVPYDDCPRLWLCCGPEIQYDEQQATCLLVPNDIGRHLERRERALRCGYKRVTYVDALSFMANVLATRCVDSMNHGKNAADIILRHVPKNY